MIVYLLVKAGIEPDDALAFFREVRNTPDDKRMERGADLLEGLLRRYRRRELPDGTSRMERVSREPWP